MRTAIRRPYKDEPDLSVSFEDGVIARALVFERVLAFFREHEVYCGEAAMQSDSFLIDAPELLATLADEVLQFEVK